MSKLLYPTHILLAYKHIAELENIIGNTQYIQNTQRKVTYIVFNFKGNVPHSIMLLQYTKSTHFVHTLMIIHVQLRLPQSVESLVECCCHPAQ